MQVTIDNQSHNFIPLPAFRSRWGLPAEFNLAYFEPKDWQGLGSLDGSGKALAGVRQRVLAAVPPTVSLTDLIPQVQGLTACFQAELNAINAHVGLREVEVEFAVAGFADLMQSAAYNLLQLSYTYGHDPAQIQIHFNFSTLYQNWLDASTRISAASYPYSHQNTVYQVQIVYNAYGRVGLKVTVGDKVYYVADSALACPAANYMWELCSAAAQALCGAVIRSGLNVES